MMASRVQVDRPFQLSGITLYMDGPDIGQCKLEIFGHEGGNTYPAFRKLLIPPITINKSRQGKEEVTITLTDPLDFVHDQFYIVLSDFDGDFGLRQDPLYYEDYCTSADGGTFYPTLLVPIGMSRWRGESCSLAMDLHVEYQSVRTPIFTDVTSEVGIDTSLQNRSIAWGDIDGDGWQDLLVGRTLYRNDQGYFRNITERVTLPRGGYYKAGAFIDVDNNGALDILFFGSVQSVIFYNDGQGNFESQILDLPPLPSISAFGIADIDDDGYPDVCVAQLWKGYPFPMPNYLFLNTGKGFIDATTTLYPTHRGVHNFPDNIDCLTNGYYSCIPDGNKNRRSRGVQFMDIDQDGDQDLYITNYFLEVDEMYLNDGQGNFTLGLLPVLPIMRPASRQKTLWYEYEHGTGVHWYDYDNDGDLDLFLPQLAHPSNMRSFNHNGSMLLRNDEGNFVNVYQLSGLAYEETHAGGGFGDINNDGLVDLVVTTYYGCRYIDCYLQQADHSFVNASYQAGLSKVASGNDICFVDYNNDGKLDMVGGEGNKVRLFENTRKNKKRWLKISLRRTDKNSHAIGCRVKVYTKNEVYTQEVTGGRGQMMQQPHVLHFGLDRARKISYVEVHWGDDLISVYPNLRTNRHYLLQEDESIQVVGK